MRSLKNYNIFPIDDEEVFDKVQYPLLIKHLMN